MTFGLDFKWTDERVAQLKDLWAKGNSGQQIGDEMGCSRNAAIGKAHRLGLPAPEVRPPRPKPAPRLSVAKIRVDKITRTPQATATDRGLKAKINHRQGQEDEEIDGLPVLPLPDETGDLDIPLKQRRSVSTLTSDCCQWPVGDPRDPAFFFCGGRQSSDGGPYCQAHTQRAFQAASRPARPHHPTRFSRS